ncbi:hypothetical protein GQ44DRAFT_728022 [Phaeosphaeriaceae sp. PMI808]|nr:hypothetical protein GQ44DRAFT_728022 [Phaeosphaeriaceae sp. PMI808]
MTELTYAGAVAKGQKLLAMMRADDNAAGLMFNPPRHTASSDIQEADIERSGYTISFNAMNPLKCHIEFLKDLGSNTIDAEYGGDNEERTYRHSLETMQCGKTCLITDAIFNNIINIKAGLIVAVNNSSPLQTALTQARKRQAGEIVLPKLKHWSDMVFLQWRFPEYLSGSGELCYVLRAGVENRSTVNIIFQVLGQEYDPYLWVDKWDDRPRWPGIEFSMETAEGQALLGTPNGSGVGFLLIQHKRDLGHKVVEKVRVFFPDLGTCPDLLFYIKDVL